MRDRRQQLRLADGRRLSYRLTGPADGIPVVYCHGAIGTPVCRSVDLEATTSELGVRHIAVSRPGIGGSDPSRGRTLLEFADDVNELIDALAIERFAVAGVSAGGPYALALARRLPERVIRVAVCSSLSPLCVPHRAPGMPRRIRLALMVLARAPRVCAAAGDLALPVIRRHPELLARVIEAHAAAGERHRLRQPEERFAAATSFLDASEAGVRGMVEDYLVYSHPWGFSPSEVRSEVQLWHGIDDPLVPIEHALQLAITIPSCRVFFAPDEGHHFFRRRLRAILALLVGREQHAGERVATTIDGARALARGAAAGTPVGSR
jgi:pimeloyl-ACP methyl ester carboxylesterase